MLAGVHGTSFTYVIMTWIKYYFYGENEYATHTSLAKVPLFFSGEVCFKELLMKYTTTMQVRILNYVLKSKIILSDVSKYCCKYKNT